MAIYRVHKTKDFTVMSNAHLRDKNMSLKAKGLLSVMFSLPDDWGYSINGLVAISKENESAIKSTLYELKKLGYLVVTKLKPSETKSGRFEYVYDVYELPQEKQSVEKQGVENQCVEILSVENPTQLNTNKSNTKELNKEIESRYIRIVSYPIEEKLSTPIEEKLNTPIEEKLKENNTRFNTTRENNIKRIYISEFSELWTLYPNKKGKEKALSAYIKARESGTEKETVEKGIKDYAKECELKGREKDYIKYGSTWFNQHGWEDEYDLTPARKISPAKQAYSRKDDTDLTGIL